MRANLIAQEINDTLSAHSESVMRKGMDYMIANRLRVNDERIQLIADIVGRNLPTQDPIPQGAGPTSAKVFGEKVLIESILFTIEGTIVRSDEARKKVLDNFEAKLVNMSTDFKRAIRAEAMEEFTAGANEADNRLAATLKETGK